MPWLTSKSPLSAEQLRFWDDNGYLILPAFFEPKDVHAVNSIVDHRIANPESFGKATIDVLHGEYIGKRFRGAEAPREAFAGPIKVNDLFLDEPEVRHLALNDRLTAIVSKLLDGAPIVCNSLNFMWGSQQPAHFDTWYMPPPVKNKLAVSSICLEDVHPEAGPLTYYPGSHKLKPYRFSHGGIHAVDTEMPACRAYLEEQLRVHNLHGQEFIGKAGDVFIWHGQLLHGGTGIKDRARTRKSLVTHYWRARDVERGRAVKVHTNGYYLKREHHRAS